MIYWRKTMNPIFKFKCISDQLSEPYECEDATSFLLWQGFPNIYHGMEITKNMVIDILPDHIQEKIKDNNVSFEELFPDFEENLNKFKKDVKVDQNIPLKTAYQNWDKYMDYYKYKIAPKTYEINKIINEKNSLKNLDDKMVFKNDQNRLNDMVMVYSPFLFENEGYINTDVIELQDIPYFYGTTKEYVRMDENSLAVIEDIINSDIYDDAGHLCANDQQLNIALNYIVDSIEENMESDHCEGILESVDVDSLRTFLVNWMKDYVVTHKTVDFEADIKCDSKQDSIFKDFVKEWNQQQTACSYLVDNNVIIATNEGGTMSEIIKFLDEKVNNLKEERNKKIQAWNKLSSPSFSY